MTTTPKAILIVLTILVTSGMGIFVIKQRRDFPNVAFFLLCLAAALHSFFLLGREWMLDRGLVPLPWNDLADGVGAVFSFAAVSFALSFPHPIPHVLRLLLPLGAGSLIIAAFALTGGNFSEHSVVNHTHVVEKTWFFNLYMSYIVCSMLAVIGILLYKYRSMQSGHKNDRARKALKTTAIGFSIAIWVGLFFMFIQPIFLNNLRNFYLQTLGFLIGTSVIFYSIVRYNAFDIETVVHKTLSWLFLSCVPLAAAICAGIWLKPRLAEATLWEWALTIGAIGYLSGLYLYVAQPYIDQLFDRRRYDLRKALDLMISDLAVLQEIRPMARGILECLCRVLCVDAGTALILNDSGEQLLVLATHGPQPKKSQEDNEEVLKQLRAGSVLIRDHETVRPEADPVQAWLKEGNFAICIPLVQRKDLIGAVCLGRKRTLRMFSKREIEFLEKVSAAATISLSNSLLLERVRGLDRMKTEFLTEVAHELRGPLSGISNIAEGILSMAACGMSEDHRQMIRNIQVAGQEMKELVEHLLDLSKIEMGVMTYDFRPVDVAAVVRLAVDLARAGIISKGLDLILDIEDHSPMIEGDKARIRQCVSNLISNAIKYTDRGMIRVSCRSEVPGIRVGVQDTGRGMTEEELSTVFERFRRGEKTEAIEGSGLGLALTKEIVESHGGRIEAASSLGSGSTFSFYLPATASPNDKRTLAVTSPMQYLDHSRRTIEDSSKEAISSEALKGEGETVVAIDDSDRDRELLRASLAGRGYRVLTAKDGLEGLELIRSTRPRPALVVTDLIMPRLSGAELCRLLKEDQTTASIPVVLVTARSSLGDMVFGIQMGADDYVAKPYDVDLLSLRIAALIRMRRIRAELQGAQTRLVEMELIASSAGTLVHSIKNPLVIIRNYVKLIRDSLQRNENAAVYKGLEKIDSSAAAISRIIDGLRKAHIEKPNMSSIQLPGLLESSLVEVTSGASSSGLRVLREYEEGLGPVDGDIDQLRMAFMNLLTNALEAMPEGGSLSLRLYATDARGIQAEIEDSGSGIREDIKGNLFRPFLTTKSHGTGLGLWTAKRIIEFNHGGRLRVESSPGKGTMVKVWLPARYQPVKTIREEE